MKKDSGEPKLEPFQKGAIAFIAVMAVICVGISLFLLLESAAPR